MHYYSLHNAVTKFPKTISLTEILYGLESEFNKTKKVLVVSCITSHVFKILRKKNHMKHVKKKNKHASSNLPSFVKSSFPCFFRFDRRVFVLKPSQESEVYSFSFVFCFFDRYMIFFFFFSFIIQM